MLTIFNGPIPVYYPRRKSNLGHWDVSLVRNPLDHPDSLILSLIFCCSFQGGLLAANDFADQHGLLNFGEVIPGSDIYHMKAPHRKKRSLLADHKVYKKLVDHESVDWAEQLTSKKRVKRDFLGTDKRLFFFNYQ